MQVNEKQKNVLYILLVFIASILFMHNPIEGYVDAYGNKNGFMESVHPTSNLIQREFCTTEFIRDNDFGAFGKSSEYKTTCNAPVMHLYSIGALFDWVSKVSHALASLIFVSFISIVALFWLKNKN